MDNTAPIDLRRPLSEDAGHPGRSSVGGRQEWPAPLSVAVRALVGGVRRWRPTGGLRVLARPAPWPWTSADRRPQRLPRARRRRHGRDRDSHAPARRTVPGSRPPARHPGSGVPGSAVPRAMSPRVALVRARCPGARRVDAAVPCRVHRAGRPGLQAADPARSCRPRGPGRAGPSTDAQPPGPTPAARGRPRPWSRDPPRCSRVGTVPRPTVGPRRSRPQSDPAGHVVIRPRPTVGHGRGDVGPDRPRGHPSRAADAHARRPPWVTTGGLRTGPVRARPTPGHGGGRYYGRVAEGHAEERRLADHHPDIHER